MQHQSALGHVHEGPPEAAVLLRDHLTRPFVRATAGVAADPPKAVFTLAPDGQERALPELLQPAQHPLDNLRVKGCQISVPGQT